MSCWVGAPRRTSPPPGWRSLRSARRGPRRRRNRPQRRRVADALPQLRHRGDSRGTQTGLVPQSLTMVSARPSSSTSRATSAGRSTARRTSAASGGRRAPCRRFHGVSGDSWSARSPMKSARTASTTVTDERGSPPARSACRGTRRRSPSSAHTVQTSSNWSTTTMTRPSSSPDAVTREVSRSATSSRPIGARGSARELCIGCGPGRGRPPASLRSPATTSPSQGRQQASRRARLPRPDEPDESQEPGARSGVPEKPAAPAARRPANHWASSTSCRRPGPSTGTRAGRGSASVIVSRSRARCRPGPPWR